MWWVIRVILDGWSVLSRISCSVRYWIVRCVVVCIDWLGRCLRVRVGVFRFWMMVGFCC